MLPQPADSSHLSASVSQIPPAVSLAAARRIASPSLDGSVPPPPTGQPARLGRPDRPSDLPHDRPARSVRRYWVPRFSLAFLLTLVIAITALCGFIIPALAHARWLSRVSCCQCHLKQLGVYLSTYASRYGSDVSYPGIAPPITAPGTATGAAPLPAGPNGAFWSHLWRVPTAARAVSRVPGEERMFTCETFRRRVGWAAAPGSLDWSAPRLSNRTAFPRGALDERVAARVFISGDLLGTPEGPNHGGAPGAPDTMLVALRWDGSVCKLDPKTDPIEYARYIAETDALTSPRSR